MDPVLSHSANILVGIQIVETAVAWVYAISIFVLLVYGGNLLVLSLMHATREGLADRLPEDRSAKTGPAAELLPFVTLQLPIYNESHVVGRLLDASAALAYPRDRYEIQVLDDSTDETSEIVSIRVAQLRASGIQITHIHRDNRQGFKAGALQRGLEAAKGEFIAIFDADFVPQPDFFVRVMDQFQDDSIGMVQARWSHLNQDNSLLTKIQAFGLDAHFTIEQRMRALTGCFINFNGTAGIWRKTCIEDAGGWPQDNLTEDFDLSYRAQLKGWKFSYLADVEVPAELPVSMNAFRDQQFRWTKGALQTAAKNLRPLWTSSMPWRVKLEGTIHLTASIVFPFLALVTLTYSPLIYLQESGFGPGSTYFAWLSLGLLGFAGFYLAQVFTQRHLYPDWPRRLFLFPMFMSVGIGMSYSNTRAFIDVLLKRTSPFVRTPKHDLSGKTDNKHWLRSPYSVVHMPRIAILESIVAVYSIAGLVYMVAIGAWTAVPFQAVFAVGFTFVSGSNWIQSRLAGQASTGTLPNPTIV